MRALTPNDQVPGIRCAVNVLLFEVKWSFFDETKCFGARHVIFKCVFASDGLLSTVVMF